MELGYRGSVNSWECDENDHLNVRFYVEKHWQSLCGARRALGLDAPLTSTLRAQHLRFLQESRLAAPLSGYAGILATPERLQVLTELRNSFTNEVMSTCLHEFDALSPHGDVELPDYAAPLGIPTAVLPYAELQIADLAALGFHVIGRGVIQQCECDGAGNLAVHHYMGRISDSMPHLWGLLGVQGSEQESGEGGAVLEYRLCYHGALESGNGFEIHSGIAEVGAKVQRFAHLLFNTDTGALVLTAQAAAVRMDLHARKAVALSPERQTAMRALMLKPPV